jgi:Na+/H+-dicarboxylate symporter
MLQNLSEEELAAIKADLDEMESDENVQKRKETAEKKKEQGPLSFLVDMVPSNIFISLNDNSLMLQVIFFAIFFGLALLFIPAEAAGPTIALVNSINEVFLKMVDMVMKGAPFFVFALLAGTISDMAGDDLNSVVEIFKGLFWYSLTVIAGLSLVLFVIYPGVIVLAVKRLSYGGFFRNMGAAQMLAFSTSSSAATLPVTMECVNENMGVDEKISSFVLPIGATVNMDGTSLYQAVAVIFLAQMHMVDLTLGQQLTIILTATLASIGSAAVPSAGLVMLIIVLESVGLNPAWIAIIFPVDRILDMCRTVINVTGDATVSTLIASSEGKLHYEVEK